MHAPHPAEVIKEELWRNIDGNGLADYPHNIADKILAALTAAGYMDNAAKLAAIREAYVAYEAALERREHGGVAAGRLVEAVAELIDGYAPRA